MHLLTTTLLTLLSTALSSPVPSLSPPTFLTPRSDTQASDLIAAIMPTSTSCSSASGSFASDCRTASQAAEPLITAMITYNLTHAGQIAAVLSLIGVESADLKYKHNVYPGRPGQGTSAMLMPDNVAKYAGSLGELKEGVEKAGGDVGKVLELVVDDRYNFGAAPWWLRTVCGDKVTDDLAGPNLDAAWAAYMGCVGVSASDESRLAYWGRAKKAFGL